MRGRETTLHPARPLRSLPPALPPLRPVENEPPAVGRRLAGDYAAFGRIFWAGHFARMAVRTSGLSVGTNTRGV